LSKQGGLMVGLGSQYVNPRNQCQGRYHKESGLKRAAGKMNWWEFAVHGWAFGIPGSLLWERITSPCRGAGKVFQACRQVFVHSLRILEVLPKVMFLSPGCESEPPVELGKPSRHPGSSSGDLRLMGTSLRILLWATETILIKLAPNGWKDIRKFPEWKEKLIKGLWEGSEEGYLLGSLMQNWSTSGQSSMMASIRDPEKPGLLFHSASVYFTSPFRRENNRSYLLGSHEDQMG
jgi:hypothetical protein